MQQVEFPTKNLFQNTQLYLPDKNQLVEQVKAILNR
jgi:hypothetical protein